MLRGPKQESDTRIFRALTVFNTVIILAGILAMLSAGIWFRERLWLTFNNILEKEQASSEFLSSVEQSLNALRGVKPQPVTEVKHYQLKIAERHLRRIETQVQMLVQKHALKKEDRLWVPAIFVHDTKTYDVKVRLRGDTAIHWRGPKKSWRVKFKKDNLFNGYRAINLVIARERFYEIEPNAYRLAKELGLLARDAGLASLKINNVDMGAYVWFEQLTPESLERRELPNGEIISDDDTWLDFRPNYPAQNWDFYQLPSAYKPVIDKGRATSIAFQRWRDFLALINSGSDEEIRRKLPFLVDMEKVLTWNAVLLLFGSDHGMYQSNTKWYYNTANGLFEPIIYDVNIYPLGKYEKGVLFFKNAKSFDFLPNHLVNRILRINVYQQRRNRILLKIIKTRHETLTKRVLEGFQAIRRYALRGVGAIPAYSVDANAGKRHEALQINRMVISSLLGRARLFAEPSISVGDNFVDVHLNLFPDTLGELALKTVELRGADTAVGKGEPLRVSLARVGGEDRRNVTARVQSSKEGLEIALKDAVLWQRRDDRLIPETTEWLLSIRLPTDDPGRWRRDWELGRIGLKAVNALTGEAVEPNLVRSTPIAFVDERRGSNMEIPTAERATRPSGLPLRTVGGNLVLDAGTYELREDLILPPDFGLILNSGVTLKLGPGINIISRQAVQFLGTAAAPVSIVPLEEDKPWGVIGIASAPGVSSFHNMHLRGGSEAWVNGIYFSGQLSIYYSDAEIEDSVITQGYADDGLNIKHARFSILRSRIADNSSDGFDGDWVEGVVADSVIADNPGDGLDFAGSRVLVSDTALRGMGDKAISAGERSRITVWNSLIAGSTIGIASKDLSETRVFSSAFVENKTGFAAYRKKPLFGGGQGEVVSSLFTGNGIDVSLDEFSRLKIVASAMEKKFEASGMELTDVRIGPVGEAYPRDHAMIPRYGSDTKFAALFGQGPDLVPEPMMGRKFSNLSRRPVGLWNPEVLR